MNFTNMDMSMLGTWHYEFWHLGIGLVIILGGTLTLITLILISRARSKAEEQNAESH